MAEAPAALVLRLRSLLLSQLRGLLSPGQPVALLDFPEHWNSGDSAIWAGTRALLTELGHPVVATSSARTYDSPTVRRALGADGAVLLLGGGNFGDLYPEHQEFRLRVLHDHPDRRVVQLPQSLFFSDRAASDRTRRAFAQHRDVHLLVRDLPSLQIARSFDVEATLAPDAAFGLGPLDPGPSGSAGPVWLLRQDVEATSGPSHAQRQVVDWPQTPPDLRARVQIGLESRGAALWRRVPPVRSALAEAREHRAAARVASGLGLLRGADTVVTDRLHGHVLATLLGLPQVLLPSRTGKVRAYWEAWTSALDDVRWADDHAHAYELLGATPRG